MLKRNEVQATCDWCGVTIHGHCGDMMVEWDVDDPTAEECGQRFLCCDCVDDDPDAAECWLDALLEEHPSGDAIQL